MHACSSHVLGNVKVHARHYISTYCNGIFYAINILHKMQSINPYVKFYCYLALRLTEKNNFNLIECAKNIV